MPSDGAITFREIVGKLAWCSSLVTSADALASIGLIE
jgi:hypothetical protein